MGPEGYDIFGPLFVVPLEDLAVTYSHLELHNANLAVDYRVEHEKRVPLVQDYLYSGRMMSDYIISACGPLLFDGGDEWAEVWELLSHFSGTYDFTFPRNNMR